MKKFLFTLYIFFLLSFVMYSYAFIDSGLIYLRLLFTNFHQTHRFIVTVAFTLFTLVGFMFYFLCLYGIQKGKLNIKGISIIVGVTIGVLLFSYPAVVSFDIFNYIATAKVAFFYHENPYLIMPIAFTHDPLLLFMHAANKTALYAPFWILLTGIPFLLGFGNFLLTLFTFKVFVGLFYLATVWLLWNMTKNVAKTAFFALNPLVIFETLTSGHNDIVMMFLAIVSIWFFFKKKVGWGGVMLLLSIGIKYATLFLLPLLLYVSIHRNKNKQINITSFFSIATISMFVIFILSSFREEIYPWYALWFLLPSSFLFGDNLITWISTSLSFSLLLRYIPFMLLGTYFGPTPLVKITLTLIPVACAVVLYFARKHVKKVLA